jgi:hypothetical protein
MSKQFSALRYFSEDKTSIGAECPNCGRVLKVYKNDLEKADSDSSARTITSRSSPCPKPAAGPAVKRFSSPYLPPVGVGLEAVIKEP